MPLGSGCSVEEQLTGKAAQRAVSHRLSDGRAVLGPDGEVTPATVFALGPGKPPRPQPRPLREGKA